MQLGEREAERRGFAGVFGGHGGRVETVLRAGLAWAGAGGEVVVAARGRFHGQRALRRGGRVVAEGGGRGRAWGGAWHDGFTAGLGGAGVAERAFDRVVHKLVHRARFAEAHFDFGGVHVHIDGARVDLQEQHIGRMPAAVQDVAVGLTDGVGDELVANEAAIHKKVLRVAAGAGVGGQGGEAGELQRAGFDADSAGVVEKVVAHQQADAARHVAGRQAVADPAVVGELHGDVGPRQRDTAKGFVAMGELGALGLEEFPPRGGVVVELLHIDHGAVIERCGLGRAAGAFDAPGVAGAAGAAGDGGACDRGDGGQRLAAETHGGNRFEIFERGDLAGGVALQRQGEVALVDAAAVVADADAPHAAGFEQHFDGL